MEGEMSLAVVVVGLAHGLAPIFGGVMMGKLGVILGAVVGLIIAVNTGASAFLGADLVGLALGTWLAWAVAK